MKLYAPSWPNRSAPLGTTIFRSKPTEPPCPWASGAGSVIFSAVQATSSAPGVPPVTFETVHVTRTGRELPVEVTLNCLEWGGRELFCAFARDITERTAVEQALRESEERYRSLFDGVPIGLYRTTPEGRMLDANSALVEILGFPSREALFEVADDPGCRG